MMPEIKKIRVLYIISGLASGGAERQLVELLLHLDRNLVEPVLVYYRNDTFYLEKLAENGLKIYYLPKRVRDKFLFWRLIRFVANFKKIVYENDIDLIHSYGPNANLWARVIGILTGRKTIISLRSTTLENQSSALNRLLEKFDLSGWYLAEKILYRFTARVIVNAAATETVYCRRIKKYPREKIIVINNGFDFSTVQKSGGSDRERLRRQYGFNPEKFIVVSVGRIIETKNQFCLLRALKLLKRQGKRSIEAVFVGKPQEPKYERMLEEYIKKHELTDQVRFFGERQDVYSIIRAADCLALTSFWEGFPNAILEAMVMGTPVISSAFLGVDSLIKDDAIGLKFKMDDETDLQAKIETIRNLKAEEKQRLVQAAENYAKNNFSVELMVEKTARVYRELMDPE